MSFQMTISLVRLLVRSLSFSVRERGKEEVEDWWRNTSVEDATDNTDDVVLDADELVPASQSDRFHILQPSIEISQAVRSRSEKRDSIRFVVVWVYQQKKSVTELLHESMEVDGFPMKSHSDNIPLASLSFKI